MGSVIWGIYINDLLVPGIGIAEKILRPVAVYLFLVIGLRIAGKRELAQLNTFDMVVLLTLSNTIQNSIIGNGNSLSGGTRSGWCFELHEKGTYIGDDTSSGDFESA